VHYLFIVCVGLCAAGADTHTPALKHIDAIKTEAAGDMGLETIEVSFYKGRGSEAKAKEYAASFARARGKVNLKGDEPTCVSAIKKDEDTFVIGVQYQDTKNFPMSAVKAIGPLTYEDDFLVFPITLYQPSEQRGVATGVKIWFVFAEVKLEEEWIAFHKERPLEFSLEKGIELVPKKDSTSFSFRSPLNPSRKESATVSKK